jgi:hypothetical protein
LDSDIIELNKGYQPRNNLIKDETGNLITDTHSIFNRRRGDYYSELLHVLGVSDVWQVDCIQQSH